jgi:hypothetical protein
MRATRVILSQIGGFSMARQLRSKKSTITNQVAEFRSANDLPAPQRNLNPRAMSYFISFATSRELSTISPSDIVLLTQAAMTSDSIDEQWDDIYTNGWKVLSERGTPVSNPAADHLNKQTKTLTMLLDKLGLSASQRGVSGAKQDLRNKAEQATRSNIEKSKDDILLA